MARLTDFIAVSAAQIGASISYAEERAVTPEFLVDVEYHFDESENIEPSKVREDLKNVLRKGFGSDWMID